LTFFTLCAKAFIDEKFTVGGSKIHIVTTGPKEVAARRGRGRRPPGCTLQGAAFEGRKF